MDVCILMPTQGSVPSKAVRSVVNCAVEAAIGNRDVCFECNERAGIHRSRSELADVFLGMGAEWSFWMDSDIVLERGDLAAMLDWAEARGAKMVTGIYCGRSDGEMEGKALHGHFLDIAKEQKRPSSWASAAYENGKAILERTLYAPVLFGVDKKPIDPIPTVPFEVGSAGFGCMLVHRDVYRCIERPYFRMAEMGEDVYFCHEARRLGHTIWALPELTCGHIGLPNVYYPKGTKDHGQ